MQVLYPIFLKLLGFPLWLFGTWNVLALVWALSISALSTQFFSFPPVLSVQSYVLLPPQLKMQRGSCVGHHCSHSAQLPSLRTLHVGLQFLASLGFTYVFSSQGHYLVLFGFPRPVPQPGKSGLWAQTVRRFTLCVFPLSGINILCVVRWCAMLKNFV